MSHLPPPTPPFESTEKMGQGAPNSVSQQRRPHSISIHILDDDSLLNIFHLCRPVLLDEDDVEAIRILRGGDWIRERWWYKLTHICRRWRHLVLASASHLGLCLICTYRTPVADMLAHSPPLPLVIDHVDKDLDITAEDEEGIMLALQHRDRVRRIRIEMPISKLQKFTVAMDDEFPILEYLYIVPSTKHNADLMLPKTFRAPHLQHLILINFAIPVRSPILTTAVGLVTLSLQRIPPSAYFHPDDLLQRLSLMPQLETLGINFHSPVPNRDVERQLLHKPIITQVTLPNLRWFALGGVSVYLEALLPRMTTPLLEKLQIMFFNQLSFPIPHLLHFINTAENLRFSNAWIRFFARGVTVTVYPSEGAKMYTLYLEVGCGHLDWQVASTAQIVNTLSTVFSAVKYLTLDYGRSSLRSEWRNEADRTQWRELLRPFSNLTTLRVNIGLTTQLSHALELDDGEAPLVLLPELKELSYSPSGDASSAFTAFINARQRAGRPVTLTPRETRLPRR
ncbi:hypothetical protein BJV74DRAFT_66726 [Russula compacta]|nr:hypothetical protein BJV74DRAFT_66726 [Russula compacta]